MAQLSAVKYIEFGLEIPRFQASGARRNNHEDCSATGKAHVRCAQRSGTTAANA